MNAIHTDKEFESTNHGEKRDGAVQFGKDTENDSFGLDKFMTNGKKGRQIQISTPRERQQLHTTLCVVTFS